MKHIGVAAVTAEGASLCYRTIVSEASRILGQNVHPEITLNNPSFHHIFEAQNKGDWKTIADILVDSVETLAKSGAEFAIIPANTMHYCFDEVKRRSPIPVLSIVEITADECKKRGYKTVGVLGTRLTMEHGLYKIALESRRIKYVVPRAGEREIVNRVIFEEIIQDKITKNGTNEIITIINALKARGCNAIILGCTEIPIIIDEKNSPLPFIDTTRLLAVRALEKTLG